MALLDIIIPQYSESEKTLSNLLSSISNQINIDFNDIKIIIVNDHSPFMPRHQFISDYQNLNIMLLQTPKNVGPGLARQYGIDNSNSNYITFIDADDTYYSNNVLERILKILKEKQPDVLLSKWMEEQIIGSKATDIIHTSDLIYLHGKFIKRKYLLDNNFKFSPNLRLHEDSFFCTTLLLNTKDPYYTDVITNYWRNNKESIIRKKRKYHYIISSLGDLIQSNIDVGHELDKRKSIHKDEYLIKACAYLYYILTSDLFNPTDYQLRKLKVSYEKKILPLLILSNDSFIKVGPKQAEIYMQEQLQQFKMIIPNPKFKENWPNFIRRLINKYS